MDDKYISYFSSMSSIADKILKDEATLKRAVKSQWNDLGWKEQDDLIDDFLVDQTVRERYCQVDKLHTYQKSFPKLKQDTGEKIVVDFENDFWTWQDEHSMPFNWRTKSQQDLTLEDLEPDVLVKVPTKNKKKDADDDSKVEDKVEMAEEVFSVNKSGEVWNLPQLQDVTKPELINRSCPASPEKSATTSRESLTNRSKTPEEVNYAFTGSVDDLSSQVSSQNRSPSISSGEILSTSQENEFFKGKPARRQRSFSKSPIKSIVSKKSDSDVCSESLVSNEDDEANAFDNPAMGEKWSSFVNEPAEDELSSASATPHKVLLSAPEPVSMDRSDKPDNQSESGLLTGSLDFGDDFKDELLVVEVQSTDNADDSLSTSKTGFDFLDNW